MTSISTEDASVTTKEYVHWFCSDRRQWVGSAQSCRFKSDTVNVDVRAWAPNPLNHVLYTQCTLLKPLPPAKARCLAEAAEQQISMLHKNQQPSANAKPRRPAAKPQPYSTGRKQQAPAAPPPVKQQKRPAQQAPPSPSRAKRQARLPPIRKALSPVAPAVPSPAVVQQNTLRPAPGAERGPLLFEGEIRWVGAAVIPPALLAPVGLPAC